MKIQRFFKLNSILTVNSVLTLVAAVLYLTAYGVLAAGETEIPVVSTMGNMYAISGTAAPQYAQTYEDVYSVLTARDIEDFETVRNAAQSSDSLLSLTSESAYTGSSSLIVTPTGHGRSTLTFDFARPEDFSEYKYLMFAFRTPGGEVSSAGSLKMSVELVSDPILSGGEESIARRTASVTFDAGSGWTAAFCDISRYAGASSVRSVTFTLEYANGLFTTLGQWQIDGIGLSSDAGAPKIMKYIAADYYAGNGRLYGDLDSIRLSVNGTDPFIESVGIYSQIFDNADSVEIKFRADQPYSGVRVYYADPTSPAFDMSRSIYKEAYSAGEYSVMTFEVGHAVQLRIVFEGMTGGSVSVYSIKAVNSGLEKDSRIGIVSGCVLSDQRTVSLTGQLSSEAAIEFRNLRIGLYEISDMSTLRDIAAGSAQPLTTVRVSESFKLDAPLSNGDRTRLTSGFAAAVILGDNAGCAIIGSTAYITNPGLLSESSWSYPMSVSKKGIYGETAGLDSVAALGYGIESAIVDAPLTELATSSNDGIPHRYNGRMYYIDRAALSELDSRVLAMYNAGADVRLYLTLPLTSEVDTAGASMISGSSCPIRVNTDTSRQQYAAIIDFLAQRYSDADRTYGRVIGYILSSQNGGTASYDTVSDAKNWASALRILYNTVSSHGAASVYMELDGGWEDDSGIGQNNRALIETAP